MANYTKLLSLMLLLFVLLITPGEAICPDGDLDGNCIVDIDDLDYFADQWLAIPCETETALVAHWKLDDDPNDSSGNGYDGTLLGDPIWQPVGGVIDGAISLDGDDSVQITGYKGITGGSARTCTAWVKTSEGAGGGTIISWGTPGVNGARWILHVGVDGRLGLMLGGSIAGVRTIADGEWHHVAVVLGDTPNANKVRLYVDGLDDTDISTASDQVINTVADSDVMIGQWLGTGYFTGQIDDVRIYDRALSQAEIWPTADMTGDADVKNDDFAMVGENWLENEAESPLVVGFPLVINEFVASNSTTLLDEDSDSSDWIEIYNPTDASIDLTGWYLTDNSGNLTQWQFPAGQSIAADGYLIVFASEKIGYELHTNFKLSADGEYLALVAPDGVTVAHEYAPGYPGQSSDISYGLINAHSTLFQYMEDPTPGSKNNIGISAVADTKFSVDRGIYEVPFEVEISSATAGATIKYTTDGSEPSDSHGQTYTGPINISETTILRAMAYKDDSMSTNVDTQTYIFLADIMEEDYMWDYITQHATWGPQLEQALLDLPSVSLVSPDFDPTDGACDMTEEAISIELIFPDGDNGFQLNAGAECFGNMALNYDKRSMRISFKREYGPSKLNYDLFGDCEYGGRGATEDFDQIILRAGSHDSMFWADWDPANPPSSPSTGRGAYIRNRWTSDRQLEMGQPAPRGRFVHLYFNGEYWGQYHLLERPNDQFMEAYYGGDKEDYDVYKPWAEGISNPEDEDDVLLNGTPDAWYEMKDYADDYEMVQQYIDIENHIDYMLLNFYGGNDWDWKPFQNWMVARKRQAGAGAKFFGWDNDMVLSMGLNANVANNDPDSSEGGPGELWDDVSQHPEVKLITADRVQKYFFNNGLLTADSVIAQINKLAREIQRPIIAECARWGNLSDTPDPDPYGHDYTPDTWFGDWTVKEGLDWIKAGIVKPATGDNRTDIVVEQLREVGLFPIIDAPVFNINGSNQHGGQIASSDELTMTATCDIYYTLDGTDPHVWEGTGLTSETIVTEAASKEVHVPTDTSGFGIPIADVGHWTFDTDATDFGNDNRDGTLTNGASITTGEFHVGTGAVNLDGINDYVEIDGFKGIIGGGARTCSAWVRTPAGTGGVIMSWGTNGVPGARWVFRIESTGKLRIIADGGTIYGNTNIADNTWHHVAAVLADDGYPNIEDVKFYVDGVDDTVSTTSDLDIVTGSVENVAIGQWAGTGYFNGQIDDARIYGRALSEPEIVDMYTNANDWWADRDYDAWAWTAGTGGVGYDLDSIFDPYISTDVQAAMLNNNSTCAIRIPFTNTYPDNHFVSMTLGIRYNDAFVAYINGVEVARSNFAGPVAWDSAGDSDRDDGQSVQLEYFDISDFTDELRVGDNLLAIQGLNVAATDSNFLVSAKLDVSYYAGLAPGGISPDADLYTGGIYLPKSTTVMARALGKVLGGDGWSALNEVAYSVGPVADGLRITEIMYHPEDASQDEKNTAGYSTLADDDFEFVELKNTGPEALNLNLVSFTNGIDFTFDDVTIGPDEYVLVIGEPNAFNARYSGFTGTIAGVYTGNMNNNGERIELQDAAGSTIHDFRYEDGWYDITDGDGFSLTIRDPNFEPEDIIPDGLVAHWALNDGTSNTATDSSAGGNDGTLMNMEEGDWVAGKLHSALDINFGGTTNEYVETTGYKGVGGGNSRTCTAWVKVPAGATSRTIMSWGTAATGARWSFRVDADGRLRLQVLGGAICGFWDIADNQWHHVAVVLYDDGTPNVNEARIYVDGRDNTDPTSATSQAINTGSSFDVIIGQWNGVEPFTGQIDDVRIYDRALSAGEIEELIEANRWDDNSGWRSSAYVGGSPGTDDDGVLPDSGDIVINEILAHSNFAPSDWIELHNTTASEIDISGWYLSDRSGDDPNLMKYKIADGTAIPAMGYVVFTEDTHFGNISDPGCNETFAFSENGETAYLTSYLHDGKLSGFRKEETFGPSEPDVAFGRYEKSTGTFNFVAMATNTPGTVYQGAANSYPKVGPIVISEFMYNPPAVTDANEYIELLNISDLPVTLYDLVKDEPWKFTDGIDYTFPTSAPVTIPAGGRILVVKDPDAFAATYPSIPIECVLGPYDGKLNNDGEKLELSMPGDVDDDNDRLYIRVDRVGYNDNLPWPTEGDGDGYSLMKPDPNLYGNDPINWQAAAPTPETTQEKWTPLTYDDFEAGWGNYSDGDPFNADCDIRESGTYTHQGDWSVRIRNDKDPESLFYHTSGINVTGYTQIKVEFWFKGENMVSSRDGFLVEYFDGVQWQEVADLNAGSGVGEFENDIFYFKQVIIEESSYTFPSDMKIRFFCDADSDDNRVYIDEVGVSAK